MLDLHIIVSPADAQPGRPFEGIPGIVIEPSNQGSRINVHRWISNQIWKVVSSASLENAWCESNCSNPGAAPVPHPRPEDSWTSSR